MFDIIKRKREIQKCSNFGYVGCESEAHDENCKYLKEIKMSIIFFWHKTKLPEQLKEERRFKHKIHSMKRVYCML